MRKAIWMVMFFLSYTVSGSFSVSTEEKTSFTLAGLGSAGTQLRHGNTLCRDVTNTFIAPDEHFLLRTRQTASRTVGDIRSAGAIISQKLVSTLIGKVAEASPGGEFASFQGRVVRVDEDTISFMVIKGSNVYVGDRVRAFRLKDAMEELTVVAEACVYEVREHLTEAIILQRRDEVIPGDLIESIEGEGDSQFLSEAPLEIGESWEEGERSSFGVVSEETPQDQEELTSSTIGTPETWEKEVIPGVVIAIARGEPEPTLPPGEEGEEGVFEGKRVRYHREFYAQGEPKLEYTAYGNERGDLVQHGVFVKWWPNGKIMIEGTYRDGKKDGLWREFLMNGIPKTEGRYQNGLKEGLWTTFYPSGKKHFEGMYHHDRKEGEWIEYGGDGSIFAISIYRGGEKVGERKP